MIVQQYLLTTPVDEGWAYIVTWLEAGLKIGDTIVLKGMKDTWSVLEAYHHKLEKCDIKTNWHVGGL